MKSVFTRGICVVGRGRWGSSLMAALSAHGVPLRSPEDAVSGNADPELYWLCVPDARTAQATRRLVRQMVHRSRSRHGPLGGTIFLHSSGVHSSALLGEAREAGASIGSVHPLMSFPTRRPVSLTDVPFAIEAGPALRRRLFSLVRLLGGKPFTIQSRGKPLYHAAAVLASPLLVSLVTAVEEAARLSGLSPAAARNMLQPIMERTLRNCFRDGTDAGFSGPFARGDCETVSLHLQALAPHPLLSRVYVSLASQALASLPVENRAALRKILRDAPVKPTAGRRRRSGTEL